MTCTSNALIVDTGHAEKASKITLSTGHATRGARYKPRYPPASASELGSLQLLEHRYRLLQVRDLGLEQFPLRKKRQSALFTTTLSKKEP